MHLEFMITPAVPNAFPTIKFTFGTVLLIISFVKIARILAIFLSSSRLVFIPSTSVTVKTGMENASQNLINLEKKISIASDDLAETTAKYDNIKIEYDKIAADW